MCNITCVLLEGFGMNSQIQVHNQSLWLQRKIKNSTSLFLSLILGFLKTDGCILQCMFFVVDILINLPESKVESWPSLFPSLNSSRHYLPLPVSTPAA